MFAFYTDTDFLDVGEGSDTFKEGLDEGLISPGAEDISLNLLQG